MDDQNHNDTWNNFTKFVLWGTVAVIGVLVLMAIFLLQSLLYENRFNFRKSQKVSKKSKFLCLQYILFRYKTFAGDYCEGVIPDPIPNSEVKPFSANGTLS